MIIVSANSASWLRPCLTTLYERAGDVELEVVVVASGCTDETVALVEKEFPKTRIIVTENRGFAYANNRALRAVDAEWVLFLNPDTEILEGTLSGLIERLHADPTVGLAGVRQITPDAQLSRTIRRFPNATRTFFEALGSEHFPVRASFLGERELNLRAYDREVEPGSLTGALHHVALKCVGYDEVKARLDAMGAAYQENLVAAINLRQIFTPDPNNVLLELNFFAD